MFLLVGLVFLLVGSLAGLLWGLIGYREGFGLGILLVCLFHLPLVRQAFGLAQSLAGLMYPVEDFAGVPATG